MAYVKPKSHKKQKLGDSIKKSKEGGALGDKRYGVTALRANMATGGGEPIPKGHKRTTERRVMQPRNPDTGKFEYNASADYGLKYKSRGKTIPLAARRLGLNEGTLMNTGNVVIIDEKTWVYAGGDDLDKERIIEYFKEWHEREGDFVNKSGETLSGSLEKKRGRTGSKEREAKEKGQVIVDIHVSLKDHMERAKAQGKKTSTRIVKVLDENDPKHQDNKDWNTFIDKVQKYVEENGVAGKADEVLGGEVWKELRKVGNRELGAEVDSILERYGLMERKMPKPEPKPEPAPAPKEESKSEDKKPEDESPKKGGFDYESAKKDPKKYYEEHKEEIDRRRDAYNKKKGKNWSSYKYLMAMINKYSSKK